MWCNYLSRLIKKTKKESSDHFVCQNSPKTKISIFYKSYHLKAILAFIVFISLTSTPAKAQAGFFDFPSYLATKVFGAEVPAAESTQAEIPSSVNNNSQTMPLLESSIDPDMKNNQNKKDVTIDNNEALLPMEGPLNSDLKVEKSSISDQIDVYVVQEGDTLSDIADSFGISVNTIRWENNISGQKISVGQKLSILPMTGVKHIVQKGDTVSKIADKYDADPEDVSVFNDITTGDKLKQGDIVFVPNGIIKTVVAVKHSSVGNSKNSNNSNTNTTAPSGYYLRPVAGPVTSPFGSRHGGFHPGVDIGNARGTPIMAAASGVVVQVINGCVEGARKCGGGYGNHIVIQHANDTKTRYAHLSKTSVSVGQEVDQGQVIGALGDTGDSTGPHLHFEVENANGSKMRPPV